MRAIQLPENKIGKLIEVLQAKGFHQDGGYGGARGGWCRFNQSRRMSNPAAPWDKTSITAPDARWMQIHWSDKQAMLAKGSYHITGLVRNSRREQHARDLSPEILVRAYQRGPKAEHPEWMAAYGESQNHPKPRPLFIGASDLR